MEKIAQNLGSPKRASLSKCIGGLLLIVGTTIGGGMLALPVVSGNSGFIGSSFSLLGIWFLMTVGALFITEVNLRFPVGTHFISMARKSIGSFGALLTWALYISLLYSLIAAYCSAGTDLIQTLFAFRGIHLPSSGALLIFMLIFGGVVVLGLRSVDFINRGIMLLKILTYLFMIVVAFRYIHPQSLWQPAAMPDQSSIMSMVTAFGFAIIIPSLRVYFPNNAQFRKIVWLGSFIPLICYLLWEAVIFGVIPKAGDYGLLHLESLKQPIGGLMAAFSQWTHSPTVTLASRLFTSVCVLTAFLGTSLSLSDFWGDALNKSKQGFGLVWIFGLTFIPPLLLILLIPSLFVFGISLAGGICVLLLMVIPGLMAFKYFSWKIRWLIVFYIAVLGLFFGFYL